MRNTLGAMGDIGLEVLAEEARSTIYIYCVSAAKPDSSHNSFCS